MCRALRIYRMTLQYDVISVNEKHLFAIPINPIISSSLFDRSAGSTHKLIILE